VTAVHERRWVSHPKMSKVVQGAALLAPPLVALVAELIVGALVPHSSGLGLAVWVVALIATGVGVLKLTRRWARHSFVLTALLELDLVFPGRAPSRLRVVADANHLARLKAQAQASTSGNGSASKHIAVALAVALRGYNERVRGGSPFTRVLERSVLLLAILASATSVALGQAEVPKPEATGIPHRSIAPARQTPTLGSEPSPLAPALVTVEPQVPEAGPTRRTSSNDVPTVATRKPAPTAAVVIDARATAPSVPTTSPPSPPAGPLPTPRLPVTVSKTSDIDAVATASEVPNSDRQAMTPRQASATPGSQNDREHTVSAIASGDQGGRRPDSGPSDVRDHG
jgi:hypothetical protein